jgi:hypothetical protein
VVPWALVSWLVPESPTLVARLSGCSVPESKSKQAAVSLVSPLVPERCSSVPCLVLQEIVPGASLAAVNLLVLFSVRDPLEVLPE